MIHLEGKIFGRLTVLSYAGNQFWNCVCECGVEKSVNGGNLRSGHIVSCGCYKLQRTSESHTTHGLSKTRIYALYNEIKSRCYREKTESYKYYGGRGIRVCDEWLNDFVQFYDWAVANGHRRGLDIDRIDVNGNYEPSNCRFVTRLVGARNTRTNVFLEHAGKRQTMSEWALELMIPYKLLQQRLVRDKLSFQQAISKPIRRWPKAGISTQYTPDKTRTNYDRRNVAASPI